MGWNFDQTIMGPLKVGEVKLNSVNYCNFIDKTYIVQALALVTKWRVYLCIIMLLLVYLSLPEKSLGMKGWQKRR